MRKQKANRKLKESKTKEKAEVRICRANTQPNYATIITFLLY